MAHAKQFSMYFFYETRKMRLTSSSANLFNLIIKCHQCIHFTGDNFLLRVSFLKKFLLIFFILFSVRKIDCESLIRKMLVLDPSRRYTIEQIKRHRWMMMEVMDPVGVMSDSSSAPVSSTVVGTAAVEPNEQILRLMAGLGIDAQKTRNSLKVTDKVEIEKLLFSEFPLPHFLHESFSIIFIFEISSFSQLNSYDHHAAIYLLLLERLRTRSASQESNIGLASSQLSSGPAVHTKHPSLEQQRRRPSSIAEQAMRKLGIGGSYIRNDSPPSRPHVLLSSNGERPMEPIPSMMTLRETNIRETSPLPSLALQQMRGNENYFRGSSAFVGVARDREFGPSSYNPYNSLAGARENSCLFSRDSCVMPIGSHRVPSNRLMAAGLDQRIIKQSTEDCRRLLQQATAVSENRPPNAPTPMELSSTPPTQQHINALAAPSYRALTSSNSFDSKSNVPNLSGRFFMSPEATKLFNTLQQSPLPINAEPRANGQSSTSPAPPSASTSPGPAIEQQPTILHSKEKITNFG